MAMSYSYHHHLTLAPRLPVVDLPAVSPRPATARPPSHSWWPFGGFNKQAAHTHRAQPAPPSAPPPMPPPFIPRTSYDFGVNPNPYQHHRQHSSSSSTSSRPGYVPYTQQQELRDIMTAVPSQGGHTPRHAPRSKTPAAPASTRSRLRSLSLSSNHSRGPQKSPPPIPLVDEPPKEWSKPLSQTMGPASRARKPLKEESISLSWPLVKYTSSSKRGLKPLLYFDVGFDPRQPTNLKDNSSGTLEPLSSAGCHLPASTHCELTSMIIDCPFIGRIKIEQPEGVGGICVLDIFSALYDAYHARLRREEWPRDVDGRYEEAFRKRCADSEPYGASEARRGMRKVDLLRGKRIFDGLTREGAHWKVEFV